MPKQFKPFWTKKYDSVQEPSPHHTVLCMKCGYLYNRRNSTSKNCPKCGTSLLNNKKSEFFVDVKRKQIRYGKNMESKQRK